jgi:hypothetical protein
MHRPGITSRGGCPGSVDEFADPFAVGDLDRVLDQRRCDGHIIDFLEPPAPWRFKVEEPVMKITGLRSPPASSIAGTALANPSGTHQTYGGFAGNPGMAVGQMAGNLLMRAVDDRHLALHEPFKRGVAKASGQGEGMIDAFFLQCPRQQGAATNFAGLVHEDHAP